MSTARIAQAALDEATTGDSSVMDAAGRLVIGDRAINVWATAHIGRWHPFRVLAEVEAKRRILDLHGPTVTNVEWWDAPESGEAPICPTCAVAEPNEWDMPPGSYGVKPEGWVSAYALAPCPTVRLLALPYADQPGYQEEWRP